MTIIDAIHRLDGVQPNGYSIDEKVCWLSALDGVVAKELHESHMSDVQEEFEGYTANTPLTRELLIPHPYDGLYIYYLSALIDYENGEYEKYNNSVMLFNMAWSVYEKHYHKTHKPKETDFIHF